MFSRIKSFLFENQNSRQTFTKNIFWLGASQLGSRLIRAIIIIYAARVLGAAEYGITSYALGFATFFLPFVDIGVNPLVTRETAKPEETEGRRRYLATAFWLKAIFLSASALIIIVLAPHFTNIPQAAALMPLIAVLTIFDGFRDFAVAYLRGKERMEKEALIVIAMNLIITLTGFAALAISKSAQSFLIAYISSSGIGLIIAALTLRKKISRLGSMDLGIAWGIVKSGWPIAVSGMIGVFMLNTDLVLMGWWRSAKEIGYYSAGQRVAQILYTIPSLISVAAFPKLSQLVGAEARKRYLNEKMMTLMFALAIPLVVGGILLARPITLFLFGADYLSAVSVFRLFTLTFLLVFPGVFISYAVIAYNRQKEVLPYAAAGSIANVFFDALFIPRYGGEGSAAATLIAEALSYGAIWRYLKRMDNFPVFGRLGKIILASAIMGLTTFSLNFFGIQVLVTIAISGLVYLGVLYALKESILWEVRALFRRGS